MLFHLPYLLQLSYDRTYNHSVSSSFFSEQSITSQYPFLGEPCRTRISSSFNFLILFSIFRLATPIFSANFTADNRLFSISNFNISSWVLLKSTVSCFSDASPMFLRCFCFLRSSVKNYGTILPETCYRILEILVLKAHILSQH